LDVPLWRLRLLRQVGLARRARAEARRLRATGHPDAVLLGDLVRRGVRWRLSRDELHWVGRIEAERRRLAASTEVVHRGDDVPLTVSEVSRASQSWRGGRFLYAVVRGFGPTRGVELGTCVGLSAAYQAAAMATDDGHLVTLEGYPDLAAVAEEVWSELDLANVDVVVGRFAHALEPVLAAAPVDYAYVDGNHHEDPTLAYFTAVQRHCTKRSLVVLDDINWSAGMRRAWQRVVADPAVTAHADLGRLGLVIVQPTP
jgi:predicted O-methyltransferase YrrM